MLIHPCFFAEVFREPSCDINELCAKNERRQEQDLHLTGVLGRFCRVVLLLLFSEFSISSEPVRLADSWLNECQKVVKSPAVAALKIVESRQFWDIYIYVMSVHRYEYIYVYICTYMYINISLSYFASFISAQLFQTLF